VQYLKLNCIERAIANVSTSAVNTCDTDVYIVVCQGMLLKDVAHKSHCPVSHDSACEIQMHILRDLSAVV
jgi:hypothetical protein